ncbi:DUF4396 domain-containing protein [Rhizobium sp. 2YAF20]
MSLEFWLIMQIAMICGFAMAYPDNWWLIRVVSRSRCRSLPSTALPFWKYLFRVLRRPDWSAGEPGRCSGPDCRRC